MKNSRDAAFEEKRGVPSTAVNWSDDYERRVVSLAKAIQSTIEDFLDDSF